MGLCMVIGDEGFSFNFLSTAKNNGNASSYTFSSLDLGTAVDRHITVAASYLGSGTLTNVTVGGAAALSMVSVTSGGVGASIWTASLSAGTVIGDIVLTYSSGQTGGAYAAWELLNYSGVVHDTVTNTSSPLTLTIDVPVNGLIVAASQASNGVGGTTWINATEVVDHDLTAGEFFSVARYEATIAEIGREVSATSVGSPFAGVAASFGG